MSIGERVKGARQRAGLSLRDLADKVGVSAQAISKYERGLDIPGSSVLLQLAKALNVRVEYFMRPIKVTLSQPSYRSHKSLRVKDRDAIHHQVQDWLERYLSAEAIYGEKSSFVFPKINRKISTLDDVERVALEMREAWQLGLDPIDTLIGVFEAHGIKVGVVEGADHFDAMLLWANDSIPIMAIKQNVPGDRQRLNLAHELGHLIFEIPENWDEKMEEKAAYRFGAAFLVPGPSARKELGERRSRLDLYELHLLKHRYGISMQAWIYRAQDLGILSSQAATRQFRMFRANGWHREEPGDKYPSEKTVRLEQMVTRALAEETISESRAAELLGKPLHQFWQEARSKHDNLPLPVYP